jgi:hypothetical protein
MKQRSPKFQSGDIVFVTSTHPPKIGFLRNVLDDVGVVLTGFGKKQPVERVPLSSLELADRDETARYWARRESRRGGDAIPKS